MAASKSGSYFAAWQRVPNQVPINGAGNWRIPARLKKSHSDKAGGLNGSLQHLLRVFL
jgi:hypothetical protein